MSLIFADGFDSYAAAGASAVARMQENGWEWGGSFVKASSLTPNNVGQSIQLYGGLLNRQFDPVDEAVVGFSYMYTFGSKDVVCTFRYNPGYDGSTIQDLLRVKINTLGGMSVEIVGAVGTADYTSDVGFLFPLVWAFIEVRYAPHGSAGTIRVKVNGVEVITLSGVTRGALRPNVITDIALPHSVGTEYSGLNYAYYDNFYLCGTAGLAPFNDFLGEIAIIRPLLTSDAAPNAWTPSSGTSHIDLMNDSVADDDTSYLEHNVVTGRELFGIGTLPANVSAVLAVGLKLRAKKSAVGARNLAAVAVLGANTLVSATQISGAAYKFFSTWMELDPAGAAWSVANAESTKVGFEVAV